MNEASSRRARLAFLRACELDVAVRKAGNVSDASPGHGMQAQQFRLSAQAAAGLLCRAGARVGERVEAAVDATWAAVGCNTNLGILLLCAPLARALDIHPHAATPAALHTAVLDVLADLDLDDARAVFRAIARANPGGLGTAAAEDVHAPPTLGLRQAMALAAERDLIARQYRDGYAGLFAIGLPALPASDPKAADVQRLYLAWLSANPDSHIVRKHGPAVAQTVMQAAQGWQQRLASVATPGATLDDDPAYLAWDADLKARRINPGTSADLTVATLMAAALRRGRTARRWHVS